MNRITYLACALALGFSTVPTAAQTSPISVQSAVVLGNQTSKNYPGTYRDGGWEGRIGSTYFQSYADTIECSADDAAADCQGLSFKGNTVAISTDDPLLVTDPTGGGGYPALFCASADPSQFRLHFTNIIPITPTTGVAYYANISNSNPVAIDGFEVGSGVAKITYTGSGPPTCEPIPQFWGPAAPIWGNHGAIGNGPGGYIYIFGALGSATLGQSTNDVFLARVLPRHATKLSKYQYWNGSGFDSKKLIFPVTLGVAPAAVLEDTPQGSVFYSRYYKQYVYLSPQPLSGEIFAATAPVPQGPWTSRASIYTGPLNIYVPVAMPHFDPSGKTLIVDTSVASNQFYVETVKFTFN